MKVLILSHSSDFAGAEMSMVGLFDYWCKTTDIEPVFIIRKPLGNLAGELNRRGYKYYDVYYTNWTQRNPTNEPTNIYWYAKQNTKAVSKIGEIIKEVQPDVVMTNTIVAPWAAIAAKRQKIPHVWFLREFGDSDHGFEFRLSRAETFETIGELSELVVANSKALAQFAAKYIDKGKISILYPFLDRSTLKQLTNAAIDTPFKQPSSFKLVITGRIAPSKGQAVVAEAVGILNSQGIDCELCVVGDPSDPGDDNSLRAAIDKYQISDKVHLVGRQYNPLPYVALADVGIMASKNEAFGRVTLEYMALGKAVVGADSGATPELISKDHGFLYDPDNPTELAEILNKYATDKQLLKKHGLASKLKAEELMSGKYSPDDLYARIAQVVKNKPKISQHKDAKVNAWEHYPILVGSRKEKPHLTFSKRRLYLSARNLLKSLYLRLR